MTRAYEEIVNFIARGTTPSGIASFEPPAEARRRVVELLNHQGEGELAADDATELAHYLELEHTMRLAKARARAHQS